MKKFFIKILILALPILAVFSLSYFIDTFSIFHWNNIRLSKAEPNKNYIKTKYIISNPEKFNAFAFGSSRVGYLDMGSLPKERDGIPLNWYNMTYSQGIPKEHLENIKTFLSHGVDIQYIILEFDDIAMYCAPERHEKDLLRKSYESYVKNPVAFFTSYLIHPMPSLLKDVLSQNKDEGIREQKELFYATGQFPYHIDFSVPSTIDEAKFQTPYKAGKIQNSGRYEYKNAPADILEIAELCRENDIELCIFTTPLFCELFQEAADCGYFDFLHDVAQGCSFYNFSELNPYTTDKHYYFEYSHYRAALGRIVAQTLFGSEEEKAEIHSVSPTFGQLTDSSNIDEVTARLAAER